MEVLTEKVEEEEAAELEEAAERLEKTRPAEVRKEETTQPQDLERELSEVEVPAPAGPL